MPSYDFWRASLDGKVPDELYPAIDDPQFGFWRHVYGDPVAIYPAKAPAKGLAGVRGVKGKERQLSEEQIIDLWPWCAAWAVSEDDWRVAFHGDGWPNQAIGHNQGPALVPDRTRRAGRPATGKPVPADPRERAFWVMDMLKDWLAEYPEIETKDVADQGAQLLNHLRQAVNFYAEQIDKSKKVFAAFVDLLRAKVRAVETPAEPLLDELKARLGRYMEKTGVRQVGDLGSRASYSPREFVIVSDWEAATLHFVGNIKLREQVERLAKAELKAGKTVPGATLKKIGSVR